MMMSHKLLLAPACIAIAAAAPLTARAGDTAPTTPDWAAEHGGIAYTGEFDFGWRAYILRPPKSATPWATPTSPATGDRNNRSKFEEYGNLPPGPYAEYLRMNFQTRDGTYESELRADHIGNNNQRYIFDATKAGEHYLTLIWDQIPHLYNTSAQSIWNGVGTNFITTPVTMPIVAPPGVPTAAQMNNALAGRFNTISIGIRRDKGTVAYRWTPDPNWDVKASYSHEHRVGTQTAGIVLNGNAAPGQQMQVPRPIDDTTQNAKLQTQYFGPTLWGGNYNVNLGGGVSLFQNAYDSYTVQNPFFNAANPRQFPEFARVSLMPSNQAYTASVTSGVDLPWRTRWNNTVQYTSMRQNEPFIPNTINGSMNNVIPGNPFPATTAALPATSLNGEINTLLINTVVSTQFTPDWRGTLKYRFFDQDNQTPELLLPMYPIEDGLNPTGNARFGVPRRALAYSYTKQNLSEEVQWRPAKWATINTMFGWEGWDRSRRDVNTTNEFIGKTSGDFRIFDIATLRSSVQYSERRYDKYDPASWFNYMYPAVLTGPVNGATSPPTNVLSPYQRQFDMANRDRTRVNVALDWNPFSSLTITPNGGLRRDDFRLKNGEVGLLKDYNWNAGIDITAVFTPAYSLTFSYMHEISDRDMLATTTGSALVPAGNAITSPLMYNARNGFFSNMYERVNTFLVAANMDVVPGVLDMKVAYSYSRGSEDWSATNSPYTPAGLVPVAAQLCPSPVAASCYPFPRVTNDFQRLDTTVRHTVDPQFVTSMGWTGEVFLKVRYIWERNTVNNWQKDLMSPYLYLTDPTYARMVEMGGSNPNYNAHYMQVSLNAKW